MTLFATLKDLISPELRLKTALYVSETPEKTQKALEGIFSILSGGLMKRASNETGLDHLYRTLQKPPLEKHLIEQLPQVVDSPQRMGQLTSGGSNLVSQLLPDKKSSITTLISTYAKVRNSSVTTLLGLAMPLVVAVLRKEVVDRNLDAQGFGGLLADQREAWLESIPEGLSEKIFEILGIDNWQGMDAALRSSGVAAQRRAAAAAAVPKIPAPKNTVMAPAVEELEEEETSGAWKRWVWPVLALVVLGGGIFWYLNRPVGVDSEPLELEQPTNDQVAVPVSDSLAKADSLATKLANTVASASATPATPVPAPSAPAGAFITQLTAYLKEPTAAPGRIFVMDGMSFGKSSLLLSPEGEKTVAALAEILKANPALQLKFVGYSTNADSTTTNKKLSFKRAVAVKTKLVNSGINIIRLDAAGLGGLVPANRVDVKIIKR